MRNECTTQLDIWQLSRWSPNDSSCKADIERRLSAFGTVKATNGFGSCDEDPITFAYVAIEAGTQRDLENVTCQLTNPRPAVDTLPNTVARPPRRPLTMDDLDRAMYDVGMHSLASGFGNMRLQTW